MSDIFEFGQWHFGKHTAHKVDPWKQKKKTGAHNKHLPSSMPHSTLEQWEEQRNDEVLQQCLDQL